MRELVAFIPHALPILVAAAGKRASLRFLEFFTANIRNPHTRRAYARCADEFLAWCEAANVPPLEAVLPHHVAAYIEQLTAERSAPSVKQTLAALRHLFDWLVVGQVSPTNPAASVRGPSHVVKKGKTPVLSPGEARRMLDSIDTTTHVGLPDRALIALMVYSFARIGAVSMMKVEDVFTQNRRLWIRLREKGGKRHEMPCHHNLETYLYAYIEGGGIAEDTKGPLFRTIGRKTGHGRRGGSVVQCAALRAPRDSPRYPSRALRTQAEDQGGRGQAADTEAADADLLRQRSSSVRYRRRESSVEEALIEMYLAGVSVRRVEDIIEALWGTRVSPSTVSDLNKKIYGTIEAWRNGPIEGEHPTSTWTASFSSTAGRARFETYRCWWRSP